jgi:hypothetical protein
MEKMVKLLKDEHSGGLCLLETTGKMGSQKMEIYRIDNLFLNFSDVMDTKNREEKKNP